MLSPKIGYHALINTEQKMMFVNKIIIVNNIAI